MRSRAKIIIKGDVQETGYRGQVRRIARKLGLEGYVENLLDGRVRIICEGEKETIEELCRRIRIKEGFITVTSVRKRIYEPTGEFKGFTVKTEDLISEMFQGYSTATRYFHNIENKVDGVKTEVKRVGKKVDGVSTEVKRVGKKVDGVSTEVKRVGKKVDGVSTEVKRVGKKVDGVSTEVKRVGKKVDGVSTEVKRVGKKVGTVDDGIGSMSKDMNKRFERLDGSYGEFASKMDSMDDHIKEIRDDFKVLVRHVVTRSKDESSI